MHRLNIHFLLLLAHAAIVACASLLLRAALRRTVPHRSLALAIIHLLPLVAAAAGVYLFAGASQAATLLIAASIGATLFANGFAISARSANDESDLASGPLSLVLPLAIVLLLSGFAAAFTTASAVALLLIGLLGTDIASSRHLSGSDNSGRMPAAGILAAIVPGIVIVGAAHQFAAEAKASPAPFTAQAFLVCLLAPATILPLVRQTSSDAARGRLSDALAISSTFIILALGVCLPLLAGADYFLRHRADAFARPIALPAISWRLDVPMLLAGGFGLLGVRIGLLPLHRWAGLLMIALYGAYLLLAVVLRIG